MNFIDKIIKVVSPKSALERVKAREQLRIYNKGYGKEVINLKYPLNIIVSSVLFLVKF